MKLDAPAAHGDKHVAIDPQYIDAGQAPMRMTDGPSYKIFSHSTQKCIQPCEARRMVTGHRHGGNVNRWRDADQWHLPQLGLALLQSAREVNVRHIVPLIWEEVETATRSGKAIDVDACCQKYSALRPELPPKIIRDVILAAVASCGGTCRQITQGE